MNRVVLEIDNEERKVFSQATLVFRSFNAPVPILQKVQHLSSRFDVGFMVETTQLILIYGIGRVRNYRNFITQWRRLSRAIIHASQNAAAANHKAVNHSKVRKSSVQESISEGAVAFLRQHIVAFFRRQFRDD